MLTFELRRSLFWGLVICFMLFAVVGCQSTAVHPKARTFSKPTARSAGTSQRPFTQPKDNRLPRIDAGAGDPSDAIDSREPTDESRLRPVTRTKRLRSKPAKPKSDDAERHPAKWRQKLKAKYA